MRTPEQFDETPPEPESGPRYVVLSDTPRTNPEETEDGYAVEQLPDGARLLVLDGATVVGQQEYREKMGMSPGRFASLTVKEAAMHAVMASPKERLLQGNSALREKLRQMGVPENRITGTASTLGVLAEVQGNKLRYAIVRSDVSLIVLYPDGNVEWRPAEFPLDQCEGEALKLALKLLP